MNWERNWWTGDGTRVWLSPEEVKVGSLEVLIVKGERKHRAEIYKDITFIFLWNFLISNLTIISMSRIKTKRIRYLYKKKSASDTFFSDYSLVLVEWSFYWREFVLRDFWIEADLGLSARVDTNGIHFSGVLKRVSSLWSIQINLWTYSACVQIIFRPWGQFQPREGCHCWARKLQSHLPLWDNKDVTRSRL